MEAILSKIVQGGVNYAIRTGIALSTGYAIDSCSRLIRTVKGVEREEIIDLKARLESKIRIISPPIDMIELIAARGNTSLDSALTLTKQIRTDIQDLGINLNQAASEEDLIRRKSASAKSDEQMKVELKLIIGDMKRLLSRIEDAVPLLMLAITTSGASLSTTLPPSVSPSRLLQASTFLSAGDANYTVSPGQPVQVGPAFHVSLYMLFAAHALRPANEERVSDTTWKEVMRKARVKLLRVPLVKLYDLPAADSDPHFAEPSTESDMRPPGSDRFHSEHEAYEFAYQLLIIEDLDDDRFHEEQGESFEDVPRAGIREVVPIHEVSKIFYADTGKILKIGSDGEPNNPVLLLKRDQNAIPPRQMISRDAEQLGSGSDDELPSNNIRHDHTKPNPTRSASTTGRNQGLPPDLDPEWIALEVYTEASDSDSEGSEDAAKEASSPPARSAPRSRSTDFLTNAFSGLRMRSSPAVSSPVPESPNLKSSQLSTIPPSHRPSPHPFLAPSSIPSLRTSLSLLELLIRLTALQQFQQASHLTIHDESLNFFLSGSSSTGAGADSEYRRRLRRDARMRVGFDPYDESPIKQRGEEYIGHQNEENYQDYREDYDDGWAGWNDNQRSSPKDSPEIPASNYGATPSPRARWQTSGRAGGSRSQQLRHELGFAQQRSPLGRSSSDSTLGTSPRTPAPGHDGK